MKVVSNGRNIFVMVVFNEWVVLVKVAPGVGVVFVTVVSNVKLISNGRSLSRWPLMEGWSLSRWSLMEG